MGHPETAEGQILLHFNLFTLTLEEGYKLSCFQPIDLCAPIYVIKWVQ